MVDVLLGLQWGDEGKGKIVDFLAKNYNIIARFQGGPNAGHTLYVDNNKFVLHTIPSGIFYPHVINLIGSGVVIDPIVLMKEINTLIKFCPDLVSRLYISQKAHLILPSHRALDAASEMQKGTEKIGSTLKGIGPAYMDKTGRNGLRAGDITDGNFLEKYNSIKQKHKQLLKLYQYDTNWEEGESAFFEAIEFLKTLNLINAEYWINNQIKEGKKILAEGAQGSMLDIDFGTYPFVTSSNTTAAGVCTGLGIAPALINDVFGVTKAYCTRVGGGPFPTELNDEVGELMRKAGHEFGATTGRPRRCGWIDLVALKYSIMLSGVTKLIMTKADVLDTFDPIKACIGYKINGIETIDIPFDLCNKEVQPVYANFAGWGASVGACKHYSNLHKSFKDYCSFVEDYLKVEIALVSNGTGREDILVKN